MTKQLYDLNVAAIGLGVLLATAGSKSAEAQVPPYTPEHITITADRIPDALVGIAAIDRVTSGDIAGYGDDTLADLLADLNREGDIGQGMPLVLLNGRRISGPQAVGDLPTESIERVEIYPAPAAQRYGGTAGQKVFNFVLRKHHQSQTATATGNFPTAGGGESGNAAFSITKVDGDDRTTFAARGTAGRRLLESERGIEADSSSGADQTRFRTLKPDHRRLVLNGVLARQATEQVTVTASAGADVEEFRRLNGLPDGEASLVDPRPLRQKITAGGGYGNLNANAGLGRWELTGTAEFGLRETDTSTQLPLEPAIADTLNLDRRIERAHSNSKTGRLAAEGSGPLITLPAGELRLNVSTEFSRSTLDQRVRRDTFSVEGQRSRNDAGASLDASIPITKGAAETANPLRGLSAQFGAAIRSVSDIGTLHSFSAGINWAPTTVVSLNAAIKADQQPPTLIQVASPRIETSGVPWFDYVTGETVDVAQITGGNPFLHRDRRRTLSVAMNVVPFGPGPLRVSVDYKDVRINDLIAGLPGATAAIQEAFPERFIRDETGTLVQVDTRPLNLVWERRNQLHWGVLMRYPWARDRKGEDEDKAEQADRLGMRFSLDHTLVLRHRLLLRRDFPSLDLLNGDAKGDFGGQPRHIVQWELSAFKRGIGARLSGRWQSGTRVEEGPIGSNTFLRFSPLMQHDFRLFTDLGKRLPQEGWARGLRISFIVANLLNDHQKVRDATGATPLRYQRGYVDPYGRTISLELRKQIS